MKFRLKMMTMSQFVNDLGLLLLLLDNWSHPSGWINNPEDGINAVKSFLEGLPAPGSE